MLNKFYEEVEHAVDIVFEKKQDAKEKKSFSSSNRILRPIRVLMRNKAKLSKAILTSKSGKKISNLKASLQEVESELAKTLQQKERKSRK